MSKQKFLEFTGQDGIKMTVNVKNIALIVNQGSFIKVTLNVKDQKDKFIEFISRNTYKEIADII